MTDIATTPLPGGGSMPVFGLGTWKMGERAGERAQEVAALRAGIEQGVTLIDTAEMYGSGGAEKVVAEAISGRRDELFLVSKVLPSNAGHARTIAACEASLRRLGTDQVDLYLLHWRGSVPLEETVRAFEDLVADGKILRWGVSNFDADDMAELDAISQDCASNQLLYNLSRRGIEHDVLPEAQRRGIPVMAYSPIEQGALLRHAEVGSIAEAHGATPAQVALAWVLRQKGVVAIPKTSRAERVTENLGALEVRLREDDLARLDKAFPPPGGRTPLEMI